MGRWCSIPHFATNVLLMQPTESKTLSEASTWKLSGKVTLVMLSALNVMLARPAGSCRDAANVKVAVRSCIGGALTSEVWPSVTATMSMDDITDRVTSRVTCSNVNDIKLDCAWSSDKPGILFYSQNVGKIKPGTFQNCTEIAKHLCILMMIKDGQKWTHNYTRFLQTVLHVGWGCQHNQTLTVTLTGCSGVLWCADAMTFDADAMNWLRTYMKNIWLHFILL